MAYGDIRLGLGPSNLMEQLASRAAPERAEWRRRRMECRVRARSGAVDTRPSTCTRARVRSSARKGGQPSASAMPNVASELERACDGGKHPAPGPEADDGRRTSAEARESRGAGTRRAEGQADLMTWITLTFKIG
jgi:hypothetical protein